MKDKNKKGLELLGLKRKENNEIRESTKRKNEENETHKTQYPKLSEHIKESQNIDLNEKIEEENIKLNKNNNDETDTRIGPCGTLLESAIPKLFA